MSALKITILGCGSSFGVPLFHNIWGKCDPDEPKNRRTRPSILVQKNGKNLLIDTSPDLKQQFLSNKIDNIDAVFYTHEHADHTHGINELRSINLIHGKIIPCYGNKQTMDKITNSFNYLFENTEKSYYPAILSNNLFSSNEFDIFGINIKLISQNHGNIDSIGFIFDDKVAYNLDVKYFYNQEEYFKRIDSIDHWIVGCLRIDPHISHASLAEVKEWLSIVRPKNAYLSHMTAHLDYQDTLKYLDNENFMPAYDGQILDIN
ncbi:MBL fold metallo-hydrolase [Alphaproteobacteria bacterium]|nr:MBL fold metallo-hydrolase [Alphaproteobacteria bacterium]